MSPVKSFSVHEAYLTILNIFPRIIINFIVIVSFDDESLDRDPQGRLKQAEAADPHQQVVDRGRQLRVASR